MRGIVTYPAFQLISSTEFSGGRFSDHTLRTWALYWDQVAEPDQMLMKVGPNRDLEFLEAAGVYFKAAATSNPTVIAGGADYLANRRTEVLTALDHEKVGHWALATEPDEWLGSVDDAQSTLRVRLANALPVPDKDVPLEDILNFRAQRKDEAEALMLQIDKLCLSVVASPERPLAEHVAMQELAAGVRDQIRVVEEARFRFRLADLLSDFSLSGAVLVGGGMIASGASWPAIVGNSLAAGISVSVNKLLGLARPPKTTGPYRYSTLVRDELFGGG